MNRFKCTPFSIQIKLGITLTPLMICFMQVPSLPVNMKGFLWIFPGLQDNKLPHDNPVQRWARRTLIFFTLGGMDVKSFSGSLSGVKVFWRRGMPEATRLHGNLLHPHDRCKAFGSPTVQMLRGDPKGDWSVSWCTEWVSVLGWH